MSKTQEQAQSVAAGMQAKLTDLQAGWGEPSLTTSEIHRISKQIRSDARWLAELTLAMDLEARTSV
jgi:hypothetical protein